MITSWSRSSGPSASTALATWCCWMSESGGSPRSSSALPPSATTILIRCLPARSLPYSDRGHHERLDRVHAVRRLIEDDRLRRLEHLLGDLEGFQAAPVVDLP